ncbi:MAG TPA: DUF1810 domain-containing protein [Mesorhizobium sp.]|jgi:uncharacterized protein (DUF1810 family)|nr:DUF1810 domain-containing protein [Mesorhizobium sp.]
MSASHDLQRFVSAQDPVWDQVTAELRQGRKTSHWMWFVFPQVLGLGMSAMSQRYALRSLDEARAYLAHPVLGRRTRECFETLLTHVSASAHEILGSPDDMKLHSSLTLFREAAPEEPLLQAVLDRFFDGRPDPRTLSLLASEPSSHPPAG